MHVHNVTFIHSGSGYNNSNQFTLKREKHFGHYLTALIKTLTLMEVKFNKKPGLAITLSSHACTCRSTRLTYCQTNSPLYMWVLLHHFPNFLTCLPCLVIYSFSTVPFQVIFVLPLDLLASTQCTMPPYNLCH